MSDALPLDEEVYDHLRALAGRIHAERGQGSVTLQPTALLHEVWEKLSASSSRYNSRAHFVAVAARAMRQILVDRARARATAKRGGGLQQTTLSGVGGGLPRALDVLALDRALKELEALDPQAAEVVLLRTFGGLTVPEVAESLGVSARTVDRTWRFARAFLASHLQ